MSAKYLILLLIAPAVFLLDQFTKFLILENIPYLDRWPVISGFFDLVHIRNQGAAFGMLSGLEEALRVPLFYIISAVAVVVITIVFRKLGRAERYYPLAMSLVAGGLAGNLLDRIRLGNVVDFVSLRIGDKTLWGVALEWPAFNVADAAITLAMGMIVWKIIKP